MLILIVVLQIITLAFMIFSSTKKNNPIGAKQSGSIGPFLTKKPRRVPSAKSEAELYQMELDKIQKKA